MSDWYFCRCLVNQTSTASTLGANSFKFPCDGATSTRLGLAVIGVPFTSILSFFFALICIVCFSSVFQVQRPLVGTNTHSWKLNKKLNSTKKWHVSPMKADHTTVSLAFSSMRKVFRWEMSTMASFLLMEMSFKWSSSLWSLAKLTNTWNEQTNRLSHNWWPLHSVVIVI